METYDHSVGEDFKQLPEIYQIEICNACDLECPMCLRTTDMTRKAGLLDFALLEKMHKRGDFAGSYYVELQMAGEPTIHPQLADIIAFLKYDVGVMVGMSTHGLNFKKKPNTIKAALQLDALTISVDSLDPTTYHSMRMPATLPDLLSSLEIFFDEASRVRSQLPFIELQLIKTNLFQHTGDIAALQQLMKERGWDKYATVRTTGDCFYEMQGREKTGSLKRNTSICLNPFRSVSVLQSGDVVSCCFIFDLKKDSINWYGNLYDNSLAEIWNGERVQNMRESHITGELKNQCTQCYLKSPSEIHTNIVARLIRDKRGN